MKVLICGHEGHGKTTLARGLGVPYVDSTKIALESVIWPAWGFMEYNTMSECHADRRNQRERWQRTIAEFNHADKARFGRLALGYCDAYTGCRTRGEFYAMRDEGAFGISIFVDASGRLPLEQYTTVTADMCGITVKNNGSAEHFREKVDMLREVLATATPSLVQ